MNSELKLEHIFSAMGGEFKFTCFPQMTRTKSEVMELYRLAEKEVLRIENELTDFRDSPFEQINQQAGIAPVKVSDEIFRLLELSIQFCHETEGLFDISFASLGRKWREAKKAGRTLNSTEREVARSMIDYRKIVLDKVNKTVFLPHTEMKISFGGVGKGYAVDRAFELLRDYGLYNFSVNGSGDLRVHSHMASPRPWRIGLRNPFSNDKSASAGGVHIYNGALATSGDYVNFVESSDGTKDHHIVDPKSGVATTGIASATVLTESALIADLHATYLMLLGPAKAINFLATNKMKGALIFNNGETYTTVI